MKKEYTFLFSKTLTSHVPVSSPVFCLWRSTLKNEEKSLSNNVALINSKPEELGIHTDITSHDDMFSLKGGFKSDAILKIEDPIKIGKMNYCIKLICSYSNS